MMSRIFRADFEQVIVNQHIGAFEAQLVGGNLVIRASEIADTVSVRAQWKEGMRHLLPELVLDGTTVRLTAKSLRPFWRQTHPYIIEVIVPAHLAVRVKMFAGDVRLEQLVGPVNIALTFGSVTANLSSQQLLVRVTAGDVTVQPYLLTSHTNINLSCCIGSVQLQLPAASAARKGKGGRIENNYGAPIEARVMLGGVTLSLSVIER